MAQLKDNESEVCRLMLLGGISQMKPEAQDEIHSIKDKLKEVCAQASQKEFAHVAISLIALDMQKEE